MSQATKQQQVLNHLQNIGSITSWEAIMKYHATRLSGIIFVLRKRGYPITSIRETNGDSCYVRYRLEGEAH